MATGRAREPLLRALARPGGAARHRRAVGVDVLDAARAAAAARVPRSVPARGAGKLEEATDGARSRTWTRRPRLRPGRSRVRRHASGVDLRAHRRARLADRQVPVLAARHRAPHPPRPRLHVPAADRAGSTAWRRARSAIRSPPARNSACRRCRGCSSPRRTSSTTSAANEQRAAEQLRVGEPRERAPCTSRSPRRCA